MYIVLPILFAVASGIEGISVDELRRKLDNNEPVLIIDVRATDDFLNSDAKIPGATHIRPRRVQARLGAPPLKDVPRDRDIVIYCACANEETSARAAQTFLAAGFKRVRVLKGGWRAWLAASARVESKPK
jgi:rhodanese-related sulfurtransferase